MKKANSVWGEKKRGANHISVYIIRDCSTQKSTGKKKDTDNQPRHQSCIRSSLCYFNMHTQRLSKPCIYSYSMSWQQNLCIKMINHIKQHFPSIRGCTFIYPSKTYHKGNAFVGYLISHYSYIQCTFFSKHIHKNLQAVTRK